MKLPQLDTGHFFLKSFFLIGLLYSTATSAQVYPQQAIRMVTPMATGGGLDTLARFFSKKLSDRLGRSVIVENRPGANGNIGAELVARSTPDGYTLLITFVGTQAVNPSLYKRLNFDPVGDFEPVAGLTATYYVIVVSPSVPAKSLDELIALAKSKPRELNFGSAGSGSLGHLAGKMFELIGNVQMTHVPYKGSGPAIIDLLGGQIQVMFNTLGNVGGHVRKNTIRALAVAAPNRSKEFPDVPTTAEAGYPKLLVSGWYGIMAPKGTPRAIVEKLNAEIAYILNEEDVRDWLRKSDYQPLILSPERFSTFLGDERKKWAEVVKASGATASD